MNNKFRAWDKEKKQWHTGTAFINEDGETYTDDVETYDTPNKEIERKQELEITYFTGLIDLFDKDIYQHDIITATSNYGDKIRGVVYWNYGAWQVDGFYFKELNDLVVVGNAFQENAF